MQISRASVYQEEERAKAKSLGWENTQPICGRARRPLWPEQREQKGDEVT